MTTLSWPGYTNLKIGDGNNESFLALFGPPDRDDKVSSIPVSGYPLGNIREDYQQ